VFRFVRRFASSSTETGDADVLVSVERFHRSRFTQYASGPNGAFKSDLDQRIDREFFGTDGQFRNS